MKQFINDWHGDPNVFVPNTEENIEYPINKWLQIGIGDSKVFMLSAYVYNEFVMFLYVLDNSLYEKSLAQHQFIQFPKTYREQEEHSFKSNNRFNVFLNYEINGVKNSTGRGSFVHFVENEALKADNNWNNEIQKEEYNYLFKLISEEGRIPNELKNKQVTFAKNCFAFEQTITQINNLKVKNLQHNFKAYDVQKRFTIPFGKSNLKVPYTVKETGKESFIITNKLEVYNTLETFQKSVDELKKRIAENKILGNLEMAQREEEHLEMLEKDHFDKNLLTLKFLKPEKNRSFKIMADSYLNSEVVINKGSSHTFAIYFSKPESNEQTEEGLYEDLTVVCELNEGLENLESDYTVTLLNVTDTIQPNEKPLLEVSF